jgi:hypothetical protein
VATAQWIAVASVAVCTGLLIYRHRKPKAPSVEQHGGDIA